MASILESLNEAQHTAVTSPSDVLQILAPPGSGKTKTLTSRVAYLLHHNNYKPWNVICLTFTIKSSREMRDRIAKLIGNGVERKLILGTFHSVCRRYLVTYGHLIGIKKDFGIADSSDTIGIIRRIVKRRGLGIDPRKAQSRISSSKSRGLSDGKQAEGKATKKNEEQREFEMLFELYQEHLHTSNLLDYDDLLLKCADLLKRHPTCVSNVEAVLIDEFQDTNVVQFDLMRLFAAKHKRVTTVGDPDQSIYGWRSAEIKNLGKMQTLYPDTLVIHLKDNYRSSGAILLAANEVIEQDESRPSKALLPTHCPGTVPVLRRLPSSEIEASWLVSEIQRVTATTGNVLQFSDFAVLLRSAALSRQIESAMGKAGIPYRMVGGQRFFDRVEIKILLDYLRVISLPHNNDALFRIINTPARGIGATTAKGFLENAEANGKSLWTYLRSCLQAINPGISKMADHGLGSLVSIILTARSKIADRTTPYSPEDILNFIIKKLDFKAYLEKTYSNDHEARWANVEELLAQAGEFAVPYGDTVAEAEDALPQIEDLERAEGNPSDEALSQFLANVALATELQREDEDVEDRPQSQVTISTIHAAKGLEWPVVFVPSAYDGSIPHSRAEDTDEERRLLYVAMTRAQAMLYMICPRKNSQKGETTLSPFLSTEKVVRYLSNKGPNINVSTVNDICRILRRECPNHTQLAEACKALPSQSDDLWPLDGQNDKKAFGASWDSWDHNEWPEPTTKRRRLDQYGPASSGTYNTMNSSVMPSLSRVGSVTTMQDSAAFSCKGFVSASSQLLRDQKAETERAEKARSESKSKSNNQTEPIPKYMAQGRITSFLGKGGTTNGKHPRPDSTRSLPTIENEEPIRAYCSGVSLAKFDDSSHPPAVEEEPITVYCSGVSLTRADNSSSPPFASQPVTIGDGEPAERKPLAIIPQPFSTHRLPVSSSLDRPYYYSGDDGSRKKRYAFLSSSPPPDDIPFETAEAPTHLPDPQLVENSYSVRDNGMYGRGNTSNKTYGVRRNMNGWNERPRRGFSGPKRGISGLRRGGGNRRGWQPHKVVERHYYYGGPEW
ncbi:ATP-dependent DNA helicase srs2 [Lecanora helva]